MQDIILENGYTRPNKLKVIGHGSSNGIDTLEFDPARVGDDRVNAIRSELGISKDDFVYLFIGRVVGDKGVNELVYAFDELSKSHKDAHLIIVGGEERELDPLLNYTIHKIDKNNRIHAVGYKNNVIDYLASSDLFVFPSYREGFPNVVMQAAAMQLNCIVSDINGCNEVITHGENGWIVPSHNTSELIDRMEWCISHREPSKAMGLHSRQLMIDKYERKYVHGELLKEYRRVLGE